MKPVRPTHVPEHAGECLRRIGDGGLGHALSLGGAFGLLHYLDYRSTHDVDAWWTESSTEEQRGRVIAAIETALQPHGDVRRRTWGDVVSIELRVAGKVVFSFQIARRSVQLEPPAPAPAPWADVLLDSFSDLVASKMVALVERGAPRDFRDIHSLCQAGLIAPGRCWELWRRRQRLADSDTDGHRARLAVETHLARIVQHRPLDGIEDPEQRDAAARVRAWFTTEFPDALVD